MIYVFVLIFYINFTYLESEITYVKIEGTKGDNVDDFTRIPADTDQTYLVIIFCCLFYPLIYDGKQMMK